MRRSLLVRMSGVIAAILMIGATVVANEITADDVRSALPENLTHPYLFFTDADKPSLREKIKTDPASRDVFARMLAESNRLLYTPVTDVPFQPLDRGPQLYDNTDSSEYRTFTGYSRSAYTLAFVYQMTGEEKYARKGFEFARAVCDMPNWVFRAHQFPIVYGRVMPWNVPDDQVVFTYEIKTSDIANEIAAVYDWLYPALDTAERDWIRGGLLSKAILPVRGNWEFHWWATAYKCNWCAWCCNGLGVASLAVLTENPQLIDMVAECYNRTWRTWDQLGPDGGWIEGGAYWSHTFNKPLPFATAIEFVSEGKLNLFDNEHVQDQSAYQPLYLHVPPNRYVNFADAGGSGHIAHANILKKLTLETRDKEMAWMYEEWFGGKTGDIWDIILPDPAVEAGVPSEPSHLFSSTGIAVMRSDFSDTEKAMVVTKAGKNDDPHHGHLDVGQVMVFWRGQGYLRDLGTAKYDELYFGPLKYDTPHAASRGHNLIFVNGEQQIPGKILPGEVDDSIGGEVLDFRAEKTRDYVLMDPTNAYPGKELGKWRRHVIHHKPLVTVIVDEVTSINPNAEVRARFHSDGALDLCGDHTMLRGNSGLMALIPALDENFSLETGRHAYMAVFKQSSHQWIPYMDMVTTTSGNTAVIAHVLAPVADEAEAQALVGAIRRTTSGGAFTLTIPYRGDTFTVSFTETADGLVFD
jgi:hypothetical protein